MEPETVLISANELAVFYRSCPVNRPISFELFKNEIGILEGGNGSGKTSILKVLSGQLDSYVGEVFWNGQKANKVKTWKLVAAGMRLILQFPIQPEFLTVNQYVNIWKRRLNKEIKVREDLLRDFFDIGNIDCESQLGELSFGQRRILDIAFALAPTPRILIADEPLAGLAPKVAGFVSNKIGDYVQRGGAAIITMHRIEHILLTGNWKIQVEQIT